MLYGSRGGCEGGVGSSGIGNRESGIGNRESGIGNRELGIGIRDSGFVRQAQRTTACAACSQTRSR
ncbi:hypothetical protein XcvCFBP7113P_15905 [Xanthomonas citri pv. vignicola]|nr:hypothetical protein XcvCFBP7113P_15905 [Xanthomonas citri pv. vignicola]